MKPLHTWIAVVGASVVLFGSAVLAGSAAEPPAGLPKELEPNFKTFASKCSQCHNPERAYTAKYGDEKSITSLVSRMARKPGAGIAKEDQKKIVAYLVWHAANGAPAK